MHFDCRTQVKERTKKNATARARWRLQISPLPEWRIGVSIEVLDARR